MSTGTALWLAGSRTASSKYSSLEEEPPNTLTRVVNHVGGEMEYAQVHTGKSNYLETKDDCWHSS